MKTIEMKIECQSCKGTGLYCGIAEGEGTAVICNKCNGSGAYNYKFKYNDFTGRNKTKSVKRVYLNGTQYKIGLGIINYSGVGKVNMDKEGVSYDDFFSGAMPSHIKQLGCPMMADQGACHKINGFTDMCNDLNGGWLDLITSCKNKCNASQCWERFEIGSKSL